jgi:hypothetical protein
VSARFDRFIADIMPESMMDESLVPETLKAPFIPSLLSILTFAA